jgi:dinuclear metal center YbgI/SA1388 family protein
MEKLNRIVAFLDRELRADRIRDTSNNGLQVQNSGRVRKVCCGVDASLEFFEAARRRGADLLVVHHGLSWTDSLKRITGLNYRKLSFLLQHDLALYASHLPLDAHPRHGNNAQIAKALGLVRAKPFGLYEGTLIGVQGRLPKPLRFEAFKTLVSRTIGPDLRTMEFGKPVVRTVAVVSGGAADEIEEAAAKGIDVYLSGEAKLKAYHLAREHGLHAIFAGHYATEVFGVRALAERLRKRFKMEAEFVDTAVPF